MFTDGRQWDLKNATNSYFYLNSYMFVSILPALGLVCMCIYLYLCLSIPITDF